MLPAILLLAAVAALVLWFWPGHGLWPRWRQARELAARSQREDVLKHILKWEAAGKRATLESIAGALEIRRSQAAELLGKLQELGLVSYQHSTLALMPQGREMALHIVRAHRLWESHLADQTGVPESRWHKEADRREHLLTRRDADALAARLGQPARDPHGDLIPTAEGELEHDPAQPLHSVPENTPVLITHIEDEPETVYAQLCAEGLRAGMRAYVMEKSPRRIRFWADGTEHVLAPVLADSISVTPLTDFKVEDLAGQEYLSSLKPGETGRVVGLSGACRGAERRRLLDLGFVPGTNVAVEMNSPTGDPTAYRVRGALIALRHEQADLIEVSSAPLS